MAICRRVFRRGVGILLEGVLSDAKRFFRDFWAVDELPIGLPDENGYTIVVDVDVAEVATGVGKVAKVKGECVMVGGLKVVHILLEDVGGDDSAGVLEEGGLAERRGLVLVKRHSTSKAIRTFRYMCWTGHVQTIRIDKWKETPNVCYRVRVHRGTRPLFYRYFPDYQMALMAAHEYAADYENLKAPESRWWSRADHGL